MGDVIKQAEERFLNASNCQWIDVNKVRILQGLGLVQAPQPNADREKQKNRAKIRFCKKKIKLLFFFF